MCTAILDNKYYSSKTHWFILILTLSILSPVVSRLGAVKANNGEWENRRKSEFRGHMKLAKIRHLCNSSWYVSLPVILLLYTQAERKQEWNMSQHYRSLRRSWLLSTSPLRSSPSFPSCVCYHCLHIFTVFPPNFHIPLGASGFALYHFGVVSEWQASLQRSLFSWECYSI